MNTVKAAELNERIKKKYGDQFEGLIKSLTQVEKKEVLIGEKYILKNHLVQAKEHVLEIENRISIIEKFTIIDNKLAFDGVICEEVP